MAGIALALAAALALAPVQSTGSFVEIGVWYAGPGARPPATRTEEIEAMRRDLEAIRRAGFNTVVTWLRWSDAEPRRGGYALGGVERLLALAAAADLKGVVVVYGKPPAWAGEGADPSAFVAYATRRLALSPAVLRVVVHGPAVDRARIDVGESAPAARLAMWTALARGDQRVSFIAADGTIRSLLPLGETAGVVTRNPALFAPLRPRAGGVRSVASDGGGASVDVKLLESREAVVIVGLNYAPAARTATITFLPEIPEAIWQNMETGTAVNFVMGREGPVLEHTFAPRDVLVLTIRKTLR